MRFALRHLALLLAAVYVATASSPCPPPQELEAPAARAEQRGALHAGAAHAGAAHHAGHGEHAGSRAEAAAAAAPPCHGPAFVWAAVCPCGCGERPVASGAAGPGWLVVSRTSPARAPALAALDLALPDRSLPAAPTRAIEHVPLA